MNRREFLLAAAATTTMGGYASSDARKAEAGIRVQTRNRHPYRDVDWATALQIRGTSHVHCTTQDALDAILRRVDFITLSNYHPSAPWWPLSKMTENYFRLHHDFPAMHNGKRVDGPTDWNAIVGKWIKELPAELQA